MKVLIPSPLRSYTGNQSLVDANGRSLAELVLDLERQFPGIRFRMIDEQDQMRPHIRFFVNGEQSFELSQSLGPTDDVAIVQALSGG
ncbi:MAG TPA: MoaD/ThiS family protein [Polyangiaceae bacterium]|nr:MoaD/ThiS family protein [Polyangiaceae bacterium]